MALAEFGGRVQPTVLLLGGLAVFVEGVGVFGYYPRKGLARHHLSVLEQIKAEHFIFKHQYFLLQMVQLFGRGKIDSSQLELALLALNSRVDRQIIKGALVAYAVIIFSNVHARREGIKL